MFCSPVYFIYILKVNMSKGQDQIELFDSAFIITSLASLTPDAYEVVVHGLEHGLVR